MPCVMGPGRCIATHPGNMYTEPWVGVNGKVGDETDEYPFWTRTATLPSGEFEKCTAPPTASSPAVLSSLEWDLKLYGEVVLPLFEQQMVGAGLS